MENSTRKPQTRNIATKRSFEGICASAISCPNQYYNHVFLDEWSIVGYGYSQFAN